MTLISLQKTSLRWASNVLFVGVALSVMVLAGTPALAANSGITYHGRIVKPDGTPLTGTNVQFQLQVRSPGAESCLLYQEVQSLNMSTSDGVFTITLNDGSGTRTDSSGVAFDSVFSNRSTITVPSGTCAAGTVYNPNISDGRAFVVSFRDENMAVYEQLPTQPVNFAPLAIQAKQIDGFGPANLLRVDDNTAVSNATPLNITQFNQFLSLINGNYVASTANGGAVLPVVITAPTTPSAGSVWYNSGSNSIQYYNGTTTQTLGTSTGGTGTVTSISTGSGLIGGPITTTGTISLANLGTAGTYTKVVTDATGRVSSGTTLIESDIPNLVTAGKVSGSAVTSGTIAGSTAINTSGAITTTGTVTAAAVTSTSLSSRSLSLFNTANTHSVTLSAQPTLATDYTLIFPATAGSSGYVLSTDGSGNLSWISPPSGTPSGSAGGDLSGTYPNPTVAAIQGKAVSTSAPSDAQSLIYNNSSSKYVPVTMSGDATQTNTGALTLTTSGVAAGTYGSATQVSQVVVDAKGRVTSASNVTITGAAPTGAASGDLSGSFPSPTVAKLNGTALTTSSLATGNFLRYNGTAWVNALISGSDLPSLATGYSGILPIANGGTGTSTGSITGSGALTFAAGGTNQNVALTPSGTGFTLLSGNVGVGTTSPVQALDVNGSAKATSFLAGAGSNTAPSHSFAGDTNTGFYNDGSHNLYLTTNGVSRGYYTSNGTFNWYGYIYAGTGSAGAVTYGFQGSTGTGMYSPSTNAISFTTNSTDRMRIDASGNVGIGTSSPAVSLDLSAKSDALALPKGSTEPLSPSAGWIRYNTTSNAVEYYNASNWIALAAGTGGTVSSITAGTGLSGGTITSTGTIAIATTGVTAGTYGSATQVPQITVNAQGQITASTPVTISGVAPGGTAGGDLSGTYPNPTVAAIQGKAVNATAPTDAQSLIYNNGLSKYAAVSMSGDATQANTGALTLALSGVAAGTYGSATQVSQITVDAKGRVTGASNVTITGAAPSGAASGDLSGTYPSPTVAKLNGTTVTTSALATGNFLRYNGTAWVNALISGSDLPSLATGYTGILPIANGGTGTATGSITGSGALTFAAGGSNQNVTLTPSGTGYTLLGGSVGIGTTSPGGLLDVSKALSQAPSSTVGAYLSLSPSTITDNVTAASGTAAGAVFNSIGQPTLAATNGSVTTTSASTLTVNGPPVAGTNEAIGTSYGIYVPTAAVNGAGSTSSSYGLYVNHPTGAATNYAAVFAGTVGIGWSTPNYALHVVSGGASVQDIELLQSSSTSANGNSANLIFSMNDSAATPLHPIVGRIGSVMLDNTTTAVKAGLAFSTDNAGTLAERMRIDPTGNVGIGTTSPATSLDLSTRTDAIALPKGATEPATPSAGWIRYNTTSNAVEYYNASSWIALASGSGGTVTSIAAGTGLSGGTITSTGTIAIAPTGVTAGTYGSATQVPQLTVNAQGQITASTPVTISGVAPGGAAGGDLSGTYPNPMVAAIQGKAVNSTAPTDAQHLVYNNTSSKYFAVSMSGDATQANTGALTLASSGVTAGTYGSATQVSQITVDAKGRVTGASNVTITGAAPSGTASGDLSGTYPSPTVAKLNGTTVTTSALATGNFLRYNGTAWVNALISGSDLPSLATGYTGILPVANGGTGTATGSITGTGALAFTAGGSNQNVTLTPSGTGATILGGNVGIGTSSPGLTLDVQGASSTGVIATGVTNTAGGASGNAAMYINEYGNGGTPILQFNQARGTSTAATATQLGDWLGLVQTQGYGSGAIKGGTAMISVAEAAFSNTSAPTALTFQTTASSTTSSVERMRIAGNGNVGIGTNSPSALLDIQATNSNPQIKITNISSTAADYPALYVTDYTNGNGGSGGVNLVASRGSSTSPLAITAGDAIGTFSGWGQYDSTAGHVGQGAYEIFTAEGTFSSSSYPTAVAFLTTPSGSTSPVERLRISNAGNVGIGTNSPLVSLDLSSRADAIALPKGGTEPTGAAAGWIRYNTTSNAVEYYNASTWIALAAGSGGTVTSVAAGTGLSGGTITSTGTIAIASTGVTAGTYGSATQVPQITVNAQGQITASTPVTISGVVPGGAAGGDLSGTYPNPTVAAIQGKAVSSNAPTDAQHLVYNNTSSKYFAVSMSGDATQANTGALTLASSGVTAGTYGSATQVSQITVDAKGRVTGASNVTITGAAPSGAASGDLSGTYPSPTVAKLNGTTVTTSALATGNFLRYNGTAWVNALLTSADIPSISSGLTGVLPVANGGTGTATGSITGTGALAFAAGGSNQNVTLTPSGTGSTILNGNVGIGTTSPSAKVDINGTALIESSNSLEIANANMGLSSNGFNTMNVFSWGDINLYSDTDNSGGDAFSVFNGSAVGSGSPAFTVVNNKVGIGTSSPVSMLNVHGGAIVSDTQANTTATSINFLTGNVQTSSLSGTNSAYNLCGLQDGGSYTLVLTGQTVGSIPTFTAYSDATCTTKLANNSGVPDSGGVTLQTTSATTILTFIRAGGTAYVMLATGFTH